MGDYLRLSRKLQEMLGPVHANGFTGASIFPCRRLENYTTSEEQMSLLDTEPLACTNTMGLFFEAMTSGLYGGKCYGYHIYKDDNKRPDVINLEEKIMGESKSSSEGNNISFRDSQMNPHRRIQATYSSWELRYLLFRNAFPGIMSYGKGRKEIPASQMYRQLASPLYCIDMDFLIADMLHDNSSNGVLFRYSEPGSGRKASSDAKRREPCTQIRNPAVRKIMASPHEVLGFLNIPSLEVEHYYSPAGLTVDGIEIPQFPILTLRIPDRERVLERRVERWEQLHKAHLKDGLRLLKDELAFEMERLRDEGCSALSLQEQEEILQTRMPWFLKRSPELRSLIPELLETVPAEADHDLPF